MRRQELQETLAQRGGGPLRNAAALDALHSNGRRQSEIQWRLSSHLLLDLVLPVQRRLHRVEELIFVDQTVGPLLRGEQQTNNDAVSIHSVCGTDCDILCQCDKSFTFVHEKNGQGKVLSPCMKFTHMGNLCFWFYKPVLKIRIRSSS